MVQSRGVQVSRTRSWVSNMSGAPLRSLVLRREQMIVASRKFLAGISVIAVLAAGTAGARANDSVLKAASEPGQWAVAGHDYGNTRFSALKQINAENASKLSLCLFVLARVAALERILADRD